MPRRFWATLPALLALAVFLPPGTGAPPRAPSAEHGAASAARADAPVREAPAEAVAPEAASRGLLPAPFTPAAPSRLALAAVVVAVSPAARANRAPAVASLLLPLSRAPPAHS